MITQEESKELIKEFVGHDPITLVSVLETIEGLGYEVSSWADDGEFGLEIQGTNGVYICYESKVSQKDADLGGILAFIKWYNSQQN